MQLLGDDEPIEQRQGHPLARAMKGVAKMESCGSNRGRLWLVLMVALGGALVSLVTIVQWERPARAHEQGGRGPQIVLEDGIDPAFPRIEAARQGDFEAQIVGGTAVPNGKYPFMAFIEIE